MAIERSEMERAFAKANAVITEVQSPALRPRTIVTPREGVGQYTVTTVQQRQLSLARETASSAPVAADAGADI